MRTEKSGKRAGTTALAVALTISSLVGLAGATGAVSRLSNTAKDDPGVHYRAMRVANLQLSAVQAAATSERSQFTERNVRVDVNGCPSAEGPYLRSTTIVRTGDSALECSVRVDIPTASGLSTRGATEEVRAILPALAEG